MATTDALTGGLAVLLSAFGLDLETVKSVASITTPLIPGVLTVYYFSLERRRLDRAAVKLQRDTDVIRWSEQAIRSLSKGECLALYDTEIADGKWKFSDQKTTLIGDLSALADIGRRYFPNSGEDLCGTQKEGAYKGIRDPVLDELVYGLQIIKEFQPGNKTANHDPRERLTERKRQFVSLVQKEVDPRRRNSFVARQGQI